ncbi:MAG TPA: hypothetical protein VKV73_02465 [Chloroflexota bacterium]|nr:hypothetical protein [Chloroflexota bacterium]
MRSTINDPEHRHELKSLNPEQRCELKSHEVVFVNSTRIARWVVAAALGLIAALPAGVYAQADSPEDQPPAPAVADDAATVDATAPGVPTLQCSFIALRVMAAEASGVRFICHIDSASPGDTAFTARATADPQPGVPVATCTGTLAGGVGDCVGGFVDRANTTIGQFSVTATLDPSGSTLGPVPLPPASITPPAQPKPLLPAAPTAPINYFPLPEP